MSIFNLDGQRACSFCLSVPTHEIDSLPTSLTATITHPTTGEVAEISGRYTDPWPVCELCLELIRDEDWDGLVNRAVQRTLLIRTDALVRMWRRERFRLISKQRRNLQRLADEIRAWKLDDGEPLNPFDDDDEAA